MAGKFNADWTEELSLEVESCPKHSGFALDLVCKQCRRNVCVSCLTLDHFGHAYESLKAQTEQISELRGNLEKRKKKVKIMMKKCQKMWEKVHEITEEKLCSIDEDRDRRRCSVELERSNFERRVKGITECLEEEENKIYALEYSSEAALSTMHDAGKENTLGDIQDKLGKCTSAQLPRVKTYKDLEAKFERMQSPNRFSSSSTTTLEGLASTPVLEPFTSTCRRQSETSRMRATRGRDTEQAQGAVETEHSEDESDLQGDMDTGSGSDCEGMGDEGGLAFKSDRKRVNKGQMKEDEKGNDVHSGKDDLIFSDLVKHLLPGQLTPLGVRLSLSNSIIEHILFNNPRNIGNAIYQVLQEWKGTLCAEDLTEKHFKKLEQCIREIGNVDAADWLIERLQKSTGQLVQPSSSPGQLVQPSSSPGLHMQACSSPGQHVQPSPSPGQLMQPSSSPGQLVQSSSSPGQPLQPSLCPGQLVQPSSPPGQLVQASPSPGQLVQPSSSPGQLRQPSSSDSQ